MSSMIQRSQRGSMNVLLIPLILITVFFVGTAILAGWAIMSRQDYKNNVDKKVDAAVTVAVQEANTKKDNEFAEKEKLPLREFRGPEPYGSLVVSYPKTWSVYASETSTSNTPVDAFFQPNFVPANDGNQSYALRVQIVNSSYATVLQQYDSYVKSGKLTATTYVPAKATDVTGVRLDGAITPNKNGSMIIVPIRDKTLKIWTESNNYLNDFNNIILPNYTFAQ